FRASKARPRSWRCAVLARLSLCPVAHPAPDTAATEIALDSGLRDKVSSRGQRQCTTSRVPGERPKSRLDFLREPAFPDARDRVRDSTRASGPRDEATGRRDERARHKASNRSRELLPVGGSEQRTKEPGPMELSSWHEP